MPEEETKKEEKIIEERKEKLKEIFLRKGLWVLALLVVAIILGVYLRSLPMSDHGGKPGLWDITTNDWTLGPDLDPFLFLRHAKEMINNNFTRMDVMRNVPLGFDNSRELQMVSYMIVLTYKLVNIFGSYDVNFAGVFMPVIFFALTIISFFLLVREIFARKDSEDKNLKANIIAIISTFFMIVIPVFLARTVAGIPEKESIGFFFMFLAFYFFLKSWKTEKLRNALILGILAGISTALMGLSWGGVSYVYTTIGIAGLLAFVLNKVNKKEFLAYSVWVFSSVVVTLMFTNRFSMKNLFMSLDTGLSVLVFFIMLVHFLIWKTKISQMKKIKEINLPENIKSLIIAIILGIILVSIVFGPGFVLNKLKDFNQMMFKPVTGRWSQTVAENRQPYFTEWGASFGPFIQGIPIIFWLFFAGSVVLFKSMLKNIKKRESWILTCLYVLFFFGLVFSRYAPHPTMMDGEGIESKMFYYGSALILIGSMVYYYIKYYREGNKGFERVDFEFLFLFALFVLTLFTARSAVRLIMVLGPVAPIFVAYLSVFLVDKFKKSRDETGKILMGLIALVVIILVLFSFYSFYKQIKSEANSYVPNYYTLQWQKAMSWVRNDTPTNSVFAHWWDYGYWVQSIGDRATVTDGGNAITYWNYLTGRLVLTGDNEKDALNFLYNHNATHLLIDSSDLGKYGAFSSIGSDANFDRFSSGPPTMVSDSKQTQETKTGFIKVYPGAYGLEEDIKFESNGTKTLLMKENSGLAGLIISFTAKNDSVEIKQPDAIFYNAGKQVNLPLRYAYYNNTFVDFNSGIEGTAYVVPRVSQNSVDNTGAVMYISPRMMRGLLAQIYILNDPFSKFSSFKLAHSEPNLIIDNINNQGYPLSEFAYIDGLGEVGPIKIWEISYSGNEKMNPAYTDTDPSKYLDWQL